MSQKSDICSVSDVCMERLSWLLSVQAGSEETGAAGYTPEMLLAAPHERVDRQGPAAQEDRQHRLLQARTPADARLQAGSAHITIPTVQEIGSTLHLLSYHSALAKAAHPTGVLLHLDFVNASATACYNNVSATSVLLFPYLSHSQEIFSGAWK